jgi:NADH:ubiquinone reductase (H+-translocating)
MQQITIIGAGYAGLMAALRLQRRAHVTLISQSDTFTERIRFHEMAHHDIKTYAVAEFLRGTAVQFVQARVNALQPEAKQVLTSQGAFGYDRLVYALGSHIDSDGLPGVRQHAHALEISQMAGLRKALQSGGHLIICGGGLTGIEAAAELAAAYPQTRLTLVTRGPLGEGLCENGRAYLRAVFGKLGVQLREGITVTAAAADHLETTEGPIAYDHLLWAGAFRAPALAEQAGLAVNNRGQILVDAQLRALSHPDIFAVGDSAYLPGIRMGCVTAMPMAAHAASNLMVGEEAMQPFRFGYFGQCISLGRHAGLIQLTKSDDSPGQRIIIGRPAALVKELICRYTVFALRTERRWPGSYRWPQHDLPAVQATTTISMA